MNICIGVGSVGDNAGTALICVRDRIGVRIGVRLGERTAVGNSIGVRPGICRG